LKLSIEATPSEQQNLWIFQTSKQVEAILID